MSKFETDICINQDVYFIEMNRQKIYLGRVKAIHFTENSTFYSVLVECSNRISFVSLDVEEKLVFTNLNDAYDYLRKNIESIYKSYTRYKEDTSND